MLSKERRGWSLRRASICSCGSAKSIKIDSTVSTLIPGVLIPGVLMPGVLMSGVFIHTQRCAPGHSHARVCVCVCVCLCVCTNVCARVSVYTYAHMNIHARTQACMHTHTQTKYLPFAVIHEGMYVHTCICQLLTQPLQTCSFCKLFCQLH